MAILKSIEWKHTTFETACIVVDKPAETYNSQIILAIYSNSESLTGGEQPLFYDPVIVPDNQMQLLFTESALKAEGVTARSQSYVYIKTLPDYADCKDLIFTPTE